MHAPQPTIYGYGRNVPFGFFRGQNVHGQNVQAETSLNEMSAAEMSYIRMCSPLMNTNGKFIEKWNAGQYN